MKSFGKTKVIRSMINEYELWNRINYIAIRTHVQLLYQANHHWFISTAPSFIEDGSYMLPFRSLPGIWSFLVTEWRLFCDPEKLIFHPSTLSNFKGNDTVCFSCEAGINTAYYGYLLLITICINLRLQWLFCSFTIGYDLKVVHTCVYKPFLNRIRNET